jgi:hypothetical protein
MGQPAVRSPDVLSGQSRFANRDKQLMPDFSGQRVVLLLEPVQRCFEITNSLLKAAHLGDHARIRPAYVAE